MVVREERDALRAALNRFLDEGFPFAELEERLTPFAAAKDDLVAGMSLYIANTYGEQCESVACVDREKWDELQRLLLYLETDLEAREPEARPGWDVGNTLAAPVAVLAGWNWLTTGRPTVYLACCVLTVMALVFRIALTRRKRRETPGYMHPDCYAPFASLAELLRERRKIAGFAKRKCPAGADERFRAACARHRPLVAVLLAAILAVGIVGMWPVMLLMLCLPVWTGCMRTPRRRD